MRVIKVPYTSYLSRKNHRIMGLCKKLINGGLEGRILLFVMVLLAKNMVKAMDATSDTAMFSALFVVGDSLLDPGNNVPLAINASSRLPIYLVDPDHPPYGRDLPSHQPSGRFSNGFLVSDILAKLVGLPYPPAYLLDKDNIMKGTSFASAGAVIFNQTGFSPIPRLNFYDQLKLFTNVREQLYLRLGENGANKLISKSLFLIWMGVNDYYLNYNENPIGQSTAQKKYKPDEFRRILISQYRDYLLQFYDLGARKFALMSLPPIGCTPIMRLIFPKKDNETCITFLNKEAQDFNIDLLNMYKQLQSTYPNAYFTFLNTYDHVLDIVTDPRAFGFVNALKPCCSTGPLGGVPLCSTLISSICEDASKYVFWDSAHPTQRMNMLEAERFFEGSSPDVQPINIRDLSKL